MNFCFINFYFRSKSKQIPEQSMLARSLKLGELHLEVALLCLQHIFDIRLFLISNFEWRLTFCLLTASSGSAFTRPFGIAHSSVEFRKVFLGQQHRFCVSTSEPERTSKNWRQLPMKEWDASQVHSAIKHAAGEIAAEK